MALQLFLAQPAPGWRTNLLNVLMNDLQNVLMNELLNELMKKFLLDELLNDMALSETIHLLIRYPLSYRGTLPISKRTRA